MTPREYIGLPLELVLDALAAEASAIQVVPTQAPRPMGADRPTTPRLISVRGDTFVVASFPDRLEDDPRG